MNNHSKYRRKLLIIGVFCLFIVSSAMANTYYKTNRFYSSDTDAIVDLDDSFIHFDNATFEDEILIGSRTLTEDSDTLLDDFEGGMGGDYWYNNSIAATLEQSWLNNWNTSYGWGDHASANYLDLDIYPNADTDYTDDIDDSHDAYGFSWEMADGWNLTESNPFDQDLNTTDVVIFHRLEIIPKSDIYSSAIDFCDEEENQRFTISVPDDTYDGLLFYSFPNSKYILSYYAPSNTWTFDDDVEFEDNIIVEKNLNSGNGTFFTDLRCSMFDTLNELHNLSTLIYNSNGHYYTADHEGSLQDAINDPGCTKVILPAYCNITTDGNIEIPSYMEICGSSNSSTIFLNASADENVFINSDQTNGNTGIYLHDFKIDGNNINQPIDTDNQVAQNRANGIYFKHVENSRVERVTIDNTSAAGVLSWYGRNNSFDDNYILNAGGHQFGSHNEDWLPCGILCFSELDSSINDNTIAHCYGNGITTETKDSDAWGGSKDCSENIEIDGNHVSGCFYGIYIEHTENHTITNNFIHDNNGFESYHGVDAGGIRLGSGSAIYNSNSTLVSHNILIHNGNVSAKDGYQIYSEGSHNTFSYNQIYDSPGFGIYDGSGYNNKIVYNNIIEAWRSGIFTSSFGTDVSHNFVKDAGKSTPGIVSTCIAIEQNYFAGGDPDDSRGSIISYNRIEDCVKGGGIFVRQSHTDVSHNSVINSGGRMATNTYSAIYAVWADNISICFNDLENSTVSGDGIYMYDCYDVDISHNNIVGFTDGLDMPTLAGGLSGNKHILVGNKAHHCTNGYDMNSADYNATANMGTFI